MSTRSFSVRAPSDLWYRGKRRAEIEGVNMNQAINLLVEGYADGYIDLPEVVKRYTPTRPRPSKKDE